MVYNKRKNTVCKKRHKNRRKRRTLRGGGAGPSGNTLHDYITKLVNDGFKNLYADGTIPENQNTSQMIDTVKEHIVDLIFTKYFLVLKSNDLYTLRVNANFSCTQNIIKTFIQKKYKNLISYFMSGVNDSYALNITDSIAILLSNGFINFNKLFLSNTNAAAAVNDSSNIDTLKTLIKNVCGIASNTTNHVKFISNMCGIPIKQYDYVIKMLETGIDPNYEAIEKFVPTIVVNMFSTICKTQPNLEILTQTMKDYLKEQLIYAENFDYHSIIDFDIAIIIVQTEKLSKSIIDKLHLPSKLTTSSANLDKDTAKTIIKQFIELLRVETQNEILNNIVDTLITSAIEESDGTDTMLGNSEYRTLDKVLKAKMMKLLKSNLSEYRNITYDIQYISANSKCTQNWLKQGIEKMRNELQRFNTLIKPNISNKSDYIIELNKQKNQFYDMFIELLIAGFIEANREWFNKDRTAFTAEHQKERFVRLCEIEDTPESIALQLDILKGKSTEKPLLASPETIAKDKARIAEEQKKLEHAAKLDNGDADVNTVFRPSSAVAATAATSP
jgi:hypothetical protein